MSGSNKERVENQLQKISDKKKASLSSSNDDKVSQCADWCKNDNSNCVS